MSCCAQWCVRAGCSTSCLQPKMTNSWQPAPPFHTFGNIGLFSLLDITLLKHCQAKRIWNKKKLCQWPPDLLFCVENFASKSAQQRVHSTHCILGLTFNNKPNNPIKKISIFQNITKHQQNIQVPIFDGKTRCSSLLSLQGVCDQPRAAISGPRFLPTLHCNAMHCFRSRYI